MGGGFSGVGDVLSLDLGAGLHKRVLFVKIHGGIYV